MLPPTIPAYIDDISKKCAVDLLVISDFVDVLVKLSLSDHYYRLGPLDVRWDPA